ncbi:nuclear transport factor 2 family protein [Bradyrhizobium sp. SRS-191]|uniref:nuclear transport factor 2 family protein n=1 Tax=Bradyrhizobium sp. SRS-191 TaxID=2962606 RepID=UPI00211E32DA|nr:nuclear transport factor 2 family protein [Bradyrhizobium sp. SRS-191]
MADFETVRSELLATLFAAFNRHDSAGVMACMTDDIIFDAAAGPDSCGRRISGAADVRAAFEATWGGMPDVSWECTGHAVFGDRALSEWIFRATAPDGRRIEVQGCDLFGFRGDKICTKSAFRKDRPPQPAASGSAAR